MYSNGYSYRRKFTIDPTKVVGASDFTDFTILIDITNNSLKDVANSGNVESSAGNDIRFETTGGTKLSHEIERYDNANGQLITWVKIPSLLTATATEFYMYYGKVGVSAEESPTTAWNSDYKAVVHMKGSGADSLGNLSITESGVDYTTNDYKADEATMDGNDHIKGTNSLANASNFTILMFVQSTDNVPETKYFTRDYGGGTDWALFVGQYNGHYQSGIQTTTGWQSFETATNVNTSAHDMLLTKWDGTSLKVSQNKTQIGNHSPTGTIRDTTNKDIFIGALNSTTQRSKARIDEVRFLLTAVSDDWRDTTHNSISDPSTFYAMGNEEPSNFTNGFSYRKKLTIDDTKVAGGSDLTNFPMLVSMTDADLKVVGSGGKVQHASGYDIRFETTGGTKLDHEIERWVDTTGQIVAWVEIPTLLTASDTEIYMYFGNPSVSVTEENKTGTWNSNIKGVWHMSEIPNASNPALKDSTSTSNDLNTTNSDSGDQIDGKVGKGVNFNGTDEHAETESNESQLNGVAAATWQAIFRKQSGNGDYARMIFRGTGLNDRVSLSLGGSGVGSTAGFLINASNGADTYAYKDSILSNDTWYLVHIIYNGGGATNADKLKIVLNGTEVTSLTYGGTLPTTLASPATKLQFARQAAATCYFKGDLDEVRISNTNRSVDWCTTEYNNYFDPSTFYSVGAIEQAYEPETLSMDLFTVTFSSGTDVTDEREAVLQGQDTSSSERDSVLQGQDTSSSERDSVLQGQDSATSERDAVLQGTDTSSSERDAVTQGQDSSSSERDAVIQGVDTSSSERDAVLNGSHCLSTDLIEFTFGDIEQDVTSERDAVLQGQLTDDDERDAVLHGQDSATSERDAVLHGTATDDDERDVVLTGSEDATDERGAVLQGTATTSDERDIVLQGELTDDDERDVVLHGQAADASERDVVLQGQDATNSERDAVLQGQDTSSSERDAVLQGELTDTSERDAELRGQLATSDERDATLQGEQQTSSERDAVLQGTDTASSERGAVLEGVRVDIPFICVGVRSLRGKVAIRHRCLGVVIRALRGKVTHRKLRNCVTIEKIDPQLTIRRK